MRWASRPDLGFPVSGYSVERIQPDPLLRTHGVAFLGEQAVERQHWQHVRPKPGTYLSIRLLPAGGGGWRIAAMVGIAIIAVVTTALTYGALAPVCVNQRQPASLQNARSR